MAEEVIYENASSSEDGIHPSKRKCLSNERPPPTLMNEKVGNSSNSGKAAGATVNDDSGPPRLYNSKSFSSNNSRGEKFAAMSINGSDEEDADDPGDDPSYSPHRSNGYFNVGQNRQTRHSKDKSNKTVESSVVARTRPQNKNPSNYQECSSHDSFDSSDDEQLPRFFITNTHIGLENIFTKFGHSESKNEEKTKTDDDVVKETDASTNSVTISTKVSDPLTKKMIKLQINNKPADSERPAKLLVVPDSELMENPPGDQQPPFPFPEPTATEKAACQQFRTQLNEDSALWLSDLHKNIIEKTCPNIDSRVTITKSTNTLSNVIRLSENSNSSDSSISGNKPVIRVKTPGELGVKPKIFNSYLNDHTYFF